MEELLKWKSQGTGSIRSRWSLFIWSLIPMRTLAGAKVPMNTSLELMLMHNMPVSGLF